MHLDRDELLTFEDFTQLVLLHVFTELIVKRLKKHFATAFPSKTIPLQEYHDILVSELMLDHHDSLLDIRKRLCAALVRTSNSNTDTEGVDQLISQISHRDSPSTLKSFDDLIVDISTQLLKF
eukprot:jgi/Hompol1/6782/HPOL_005101-RA